MPETDTDKVWTTPTIEDFAVRGVTGHYFSAGIDNYEVDNPVGYGAS